MTDRGYKIRNITYSADIVALLTAEMREETINVVRNSQGHGSGLNLTAHISIFKITMLQ